MKRNLARSPLNHSVVLEQLSGASWPDFVRRYERDGIPFLDTISAYAIGGNTGDSAMNPDAASGATALCLSNYFRQVRCLETTPIRLKYLDDRVRKAGVRNVSIHSGSTEALPFGDRTFDAIVWVLSVLYPASLESSLFEIRRVMRPEAAATFVVWAHASPETDSATRNVSAESDATRELLVKLEATSFHDVSIETCVCRCVAPSRDALVEAIMKAGLPEHARKDLGLESGWKLAMGRPDRRAVECPEVKVSFSSWIVRAHTR